MKKKIVTQKIVRRVLLAFILIVLGCLIFLILFFKTCLIQKSIYGLKRTFTKEQVIFIGEDASWSEEYKTLAERAVWKYPPATPDDTILTMKKMLLILDRYGYDMTKFKKDTSKRSYTILFDVHKKEMDNYSLKELFSVTGRGRERPILQICKNCGYDDFYESSTIASIEVLLSPLNRKPDCIVLSVAYFEDGIYETYAFEKIQLPIVEHKDDSELSKFYYQIQQSKNKVLESPDVDMPEVIFWTWEDGEKHISYERPIQLNKGGAY